jgi:hypothetical protein
MVANLTNVTASEKWRRMRQFDTILRQCYGQSCHSGRHQLCGVRLDVFTLTLWPKELLVATLNRRGIIF